jgi:hypothetical protein
MASTMTRLSRNDDGEGSSSLPQMSTFNYLGWGAGKIRSTTLDERDLKAAKLYILKNSEEVESYLE